jgi:hypothetical protein
MDRLGVGQSAIEVEYNRANHGSRRELITKAQPDCLAPINFFGLILLRNEFSTGASLRCYGLASFGSTGFFG